MKVVQAKTSGMGIQQKLFALAVIPVLITTLILGYYVTSSRLKDVDNSLVERGHALATHLAQAVEFGLFSGNKALVDNIAIQALREPDLVKLIVYDKDGKTFLQQPSGDSNKLLNDYLHFRKTVFETVLPISDAENQLLFPQNSDSVLQALGEVEVVLSRIHSQQRQREILINSFLIMASGLLISGILALRLGGAVATPIIQLTRAVQMLSKGEFSTRLDTRTSGELQTLQNGFNSMAVSLAKAQLDLKEQVSQATKELQKTVFELERKNDELEAARKGAIEAGKAKTDFLAKMSHEIRTPVNAVVGFARLLEKESTTDKQREYSQTINQAGIQLSSLIDDILNFSKLETGNVTLENIPFDIRDCLDDVIAMLRPAANEKNLEFVLDIAPDVPVHLYGDPTRMSQIAANLLNNAIKFTSTGYVLLELHKLVTNDDFVTLQLNVKDSGIGINSYDLGNLFTAFSQVDATITRRFGGTGLGLAIVKRLAELMSGSVAVSSEPGKGTNVTVEMTLQKQELATDEYLSVSLPLSVSYYESQQRTRRATCHQFQRLGVELDEASDMSDLLSTLVKEKKPDLVVLGLRTEESHPGVLLATIGSIRQMYLGPILLLVSNEEFNVAGVLKKEKSIVWITKPVRKSTLLRLIQQMTSSNVTTEDLDHKEPGAKSQHAMQGRRVLVVEDNAFNIILVTTLLKQGGVQVVEARDGKEAIELFLKHDPDLILMDIHMPVMDGKEATKQIRMMEGEGRHTPIIALTADVFVNEEKQLAAMGFDDLLLKPLNEVKLWDIMQKHCSDENSVASSYSVRARDQLSTVISTVLVPPALKGKLVTQVREHVVELERCLLAEDIFSVHEEAHKLSGLVGYFGLTELLEHARKLESVAEAGSLSESKKQFQVISEILEKTLASI